MNVVIDIRPLMGGRTSGIEIYIHNLLENMAKLDTENRYILFANAVKDQSSYVPHIQQKNFTILQTRIPNKLLNLSIFLFRWPKLDRLILGKLIRSSKTDFIPGPVNEKRINIFFMPDLRPCALSHNVKKILTIHDLAFHHFPQFFKLKTRIWYRLMRPKKEIIEGQKIIAVSHATKNDLVKTYNTLPEKIHVIYHGISADFGNNIGEESKRTIMTKYHLPAKFFLSMCTIEPRKNILRLIEAFMLFKNNNPQNDIKLVLAGTKNKKIFKNVQFPYKNEIILSGFIDEKDKAALYTMAEAFVYPSLWEGFGLPLLEAMKCKIPIITSNNTSMKEIVGGSGILVNPESTQELSFAMEKILDPILRAQFKIEMAEKIKNFSWGKCARETLNVFYA